MPTLPEMLRLQNIFGAPSATSAMPADGPTALTAPPLVNVPQDPYSGINFIPNNPTSASPDATPPTTGSNTSIDGTGAHDFDAASRMRELYTPHTTSIDRFNQMIDQYPQRSNYEPSMLRRIAGALTMFGRGGPTLAQQVVEKPWTDAITDWQNKMKPLGEAANIERYQNTNERTAAYQTVASELRQRAQDLKDKNDMINAQIREHRASVYEFKATHPGLKLAFPKGGNVMAIDPITGQSHDTGIPTGSMTELDKMNLNFEDTMKEIGARGAEQRTTEGVKEGYRQEDIAARGAQARRTKEVTPGGKTGAGAKPETPTQTRVRQFNSARQLFNSRPDLRPFIKLGTPSNNDFTVVAPSDGFFGHSGPTAQQYKEIQDTIYGNTAPAPVTSHGTDNTPPPKVPDGRVGIKDKTGKLIGSIPDTPEQRNLAAKSGYTIVATTTTGATK